ncbi:hypothetical protein H6G33_34155 [Calothrix sp. FACHB-1219]|uniref:hypothetical protein n=1 Tax=unclassified Calothrix TaxID=2619626 RepID=UPI001683A9DA|nr:MULTISPECIES: hypothetical protein [unclassified Calothrix]MBD2207416.1 hypothetical protein [Calothrix sp. FACHB-168]MBD2221992.1 hypothetical protein [Calothrix sp. FACHB-1219]
MLGYSQFIYGKFYNWNSGYCLVAHTPDLKEHQEQLQKIAQKEYRFWGSQPPEGNKKAVGIFPLKKQLGTFFPQDYLVLIQTEQANKASGGTSYTQQRYIFVPRKDIVNNSTLLLRLWNILIPTFPDTLVEDIQYFQPELIQLSPKADSSDEEILEVLNSLKDKQANQRSLLLSVLSALLNQQKIILTIDGETTTIPQKFLDSILSLLPLNCRNSLSVAIGNIDENRCDWADLIIKTHGYPDSRKLPPSTLWLNRKSKEFLPEVDNNLLEHLYVEDIVAYVDADSDSIPRMLTFLEKLTGDEFRLDNLNQADILAQIIPSLLPEKYQIDTWYKYIPILHNPEAIIEKDIDQDSLLCLWQGLERLETSCLGYEQFILRVTQKFKLEQLVYVLEHRLSNNLNLAEKLIFELFDIVDINDSHIANILSEICIKILQSKSLLDIEKTWKLAVQFGEKISIFSNYNDKFILLDIVFLNDKFFERFHVNYFGRIVYLLAYVDIEKIHSSNLYQQYLEKSFPKVKEYLDLLLENPKNNLTCILDIADEMEMDSHNVDKACNSFLNRCAGISYEESLPLLHRLIENSVEKNPHLQLNTEKFSQTFSYFKSLKPEIREILNQIENDSGNWSHWYSLVNILCKDTQKQIEFLDKKINPFPLFSVEILTKWISLLQNNSLNSSSLFISNTWSKLDIDIIQDFISYNLNNSQNILLLSHYLVKKKCFKLISGYLLKYLCQLWLTNKSINSTQLDLWNFIVSVNNQYLKSSDWLELIRVSWYLEQETVISLEEVNLSDREKDITYQYAAKIIKDSANLETGQKIIHDCYRLKLHKSEIQKLVSSLISKLSLQPHEIVKLLTHSENTWKLDIYARKTIITDIASTQKDNPLLQYIVEKIMLPIQDLSKNSIMS